MKADIITAEIGSTTTVVNAFTGIFSAGEEPALAGQGTAPTTVPDGPVTGGLQAALRDLKKQLGTRHLRWDRFFAASSAAGGLRMTVHGLVYDMTVRAAREAALGAGANIHLVTAGKLTLSDLQAIRGISPNIILLAGGVDYGERDTALYNAHAVAELDLPIPVIYAGNVQNRREVETVFRNSPNKLYLVDNVYPKIDRLEVGPARKVIQDVFEEHITRALGMEQVRELVDGPIIPTPGAVMLASCLLEETVGDLAVIDIGGATTDVHSVTRGSENIGRMLISPEPAAKRTVEGDLGVFINRMNVIGLVGIGDLGERLGISDPEAFAAAVGRIPEGKLQEQFVCELAAAAASEGMKRHAGTLRDFYGPDGKTTVAEGKDLTAVRSLIGTGGVLTRLSCGRRILESVLSLSTGRDLLPGKGTKVFIDTDYIMASAGVLSKEYPGKALRLLKKSLGIGGE